MTTLSDATPHVTSLDRLHVQEGIPSAVASTLQNVRRTLLRYISFYILFLALVGCEFIFLSMALASPLPTNSVAYGLAILFFTLFAFFPLRLVMQSRRMEAPQHWVAHYVRSVRALAGSDPESCEYHMVCASSLFRLATKLDEYSGEVLPRFPFEMLTPTFHRISELLFWEDIWRFQEAILLLAVDEHIELVKQEPTNLQIHAALANAYVLLSGIYVDSHIPETFSSFFGRSAHAEAMVQERRRKFRRAAECSIEEYKILKDYAPDDPWVHAQLAYCYADLKMPELEIQEYEILLVLRPDDFEALYKLGTLYFQVGQNSKGLRIYEALKRQSAKRAKELIAQYGVVLNRKEA